MGNRPRHGVVVLARDDQQRSTLGILRGDTENPERGPLLIISGEDDNTVPWAIAHASYKQQEKNPGVTEIRELPDRGHSLVIDHGWREVAETALAFIAQQLQKGQ